MKALLYTGGKLFLICAVAAVALGLVNGITAPITKERKERELKEALGRLFPEATIGDLNLAAESDAVAEFYPVTRDSGLIGYILSLRAMGYGGEMTVLAGYRTDGEVVSVVLMDNLETPGLGKKAEDPSYMNKFVGTGAREAVPVRKGMLSSADADAVSGASITFIGIAKALAEGSGFVKDLR